MNETTPQIARAIYDVAIEAVIQYSLATSPWLNLPVVRFLFTFIVTRVAGLIYDRIETGTELIIIGVKVENQSKQYKDAVAEFQQALESKKPEEVSVAKQNLKDALRDLININN